MGSGVSRYSCYATHKGLMEMDRHFCTAVGIQRRCMRPLNYFEVAPCFRGENDVVFSEEISFFFPIRYTK